MRIHSIKVFQENRRNLRKNATPQEVALWNHLKNSNLGYKFQRQHGFGKFIVDFYCAKRKLVVEIDGNQHAQADKKVSDQERTWYLENLGIQVIRFWNKEIDTNLPAVLNGIIDLLKK